MGRWFSHEDGALITGIDALTKEILESCLSCSSMWDHNENATLWTSTEVLTRHWIHQCLHPGFPSLQNCEETNFHCLSPQQQKLATENILNTIYMAPSIKFLHWVNHNWGRIIPCIIDITGDHPAVASLHSTCLCLGLPVISSYSSDG